MLRSILVIALGGAIGSVCRYLLQVGVHKIAPITFPLGTLIVNVLGCFIIGLLYGMAVKMPQFSIQWRLFLITGICGGFTTFSSFSYEGISLIMERNYFYFFMYLGGSVLLGLLATWVGLILVK
ncbi:fluoride efflux transporter CrcB [Arachidicoccus ginsenosidivorans]|jgi:CrcB protein|uniref:Fluoride-specific ion channel FluC n=1 Tax=Arachidicoccus ginsenosidivorans TaxID=496057 RepID=A0A5B8VI45_9BACT|nr:fluoride efflux transporter CrcB [Arachidicoccus ginsenosidivorans]QEC70731.1 fluoride efflux transporter CrcB [Arachidicoccus ginsenosidivorans]